MSLFVLGILTAAAGFVAIGFGISIPSAFSLGNTLIVAGTIGVVGGFILLGLGTVVRELKRLAQSGALYPSNLANLAPAHAGDHFDQHPHAQLANSQAGFVATSKPEPSLRAPPPPEPKLAMAPSTEPDPIEWLRPKNKEPTLGERAVIEEFEASLAPQSQSPPPPRPVPPPSMPKMPEPKLWIQNSPGEPATEISPAMRAELVARSAPSSERPSSGLFDSVWPDMRSARSAETIERKRKADAPAPARDEARLGKDAAREAQAPRSEEARPVAILKSGMIDGMAYTLFADGSIEAVLATGTIRFASVDALREHLEKNG